MQPGVARGKGKDRVILVEGIGLVDNFMASEDLNECVEALLQKRPKSGNH